MKFFQIYAMAFLALYIGLVSATNALPHNQSQVSQALGHFIWSELKSDSSTPISLEAVIEGMRKAEAGIPCPLSSYKLLECYGQFEEDHYNAQVSKNLARAEEFLDQLKNKPAIQTVVPGRLYIEILSPGTVAVAEKEENPRFNIKCELLDGFELVDTFRSGMPVTQDLNTAIRGFKEGISGMKGGEKRRLYIHPEYGYGQFCHIEPNGLLIVEVELVLKESNTAASEAIEEFDKVKVLDL